MRPTENDSKPTVLHLVEAFSGGVAVFIRRLVEQPSMRDYKHFVMAGSTRSHAEPNLDDGTTFLPWPSARQNIAPLSDTRAMLEAISVIRDINPSVIHCHSSKGGALGRLAAAALGRRKRVLYTPHGVAFLRQDISVAKRYTFSQIERLLSRISPTVVACSDSESQELAKFGIKSTTIPNAIPVHDAPRRRGPSDVVRVITVGRITRQKNPQQFAAIATTLASNPAIQFVWIGDGEDRDVLKSANITVTGWLSTERVMNELSQSDIYLSCAAWEGMPLAVLEAMASGLPLVVSNSVGNRDLVQQRLNGFIYTSSDEACSHIEYLFENPDIRQSMGLESYSMASEKHRLIDQARMYVDIYRQLHP